ncbi:MAG: hypothetical protein CL768_00165 [Chloroflexi bacterium]|nr:hypothetical protein [Chloroflexota bacterium]|tara:strand:+ start:5217 stop:8084 length:2868 start_codon:yes stop_codon:yes gene_type:complete
MSNSSFINNFWGEIMFNFRKNLVSLFVFSFALFSFNLPAEDAEVEEVVVTGSLIKISAQNKSVPVDVIGRDELEAEGSPNMVDVILNLPSMSGTMNQQDQFQGSGVATGMKNINIRGMGGDRGLVLINGKRIAPAAVRSAKSAVYPVDVGNFPMIAMQRMELLKNGGAVTYGSDAMTGVLNFITRRGFEGFEIKANATDYDGSDGDQNLSMVWGTGSGSANLMIAVEYEKRDRLPVWERSFVDYSSPTGWPVGISSFGNPGGFGPALGWPGTLYAGLDRDPKCGYTSEYTSSFALSLGRCGYNYTPFFNLIDEQERHKFYAQVDFEITESTSVYMDVLYADLEGWYNTSPSFPHTNPGSSNYCAGDPLSCTSAVPYFMYVPLNNPGAVDFLSTLSAERQAQYQGAGGLHFWGRTLAVEGPSQSGKRFHETMRLNGGIRHAFDNMDLDVSITYTNHSVDGYTYDPLHLRVQDALAGLSGHDCPRVGSNPWDSANDSLRGDTASGCYWYNPFGTAIDAAPGSALANHPSVRKYFNGVSSGITQVENVVTEAILTGESGIELGGGNVAWAAGYQYRWWDSKYNPTGDNRVDGPQNSPFVFLGVEQPSYIETRVWSLFGEAALPITENAVITLGARHEDYGLDSLTKPKLSLIADVSDTVTVRASYEQVFRVPTIPTQSTVSLELYQPAGEYIQIETPVPTSLNPEESTNIGFGVIVRPNDQLTINLDYYSLALEGPFNREASTCACSDKVTGDGTLFDPATDVPQDITKIIAELINGDDVDTSGVDLEVKYTFENGLGNWSVGGNMNHIMEYDVSGTADGQSYDGAGKYNLRSTVLPIELRMMPDLKYNAYATLFMDNGVYARLFARYIDGVEIPSTFDSIATFQGAGQFMDLQIDDHLTFDFHIGWSAMDDQIEATLSVINLTDEEPPLAPHELGYDSYTHNPLGRQVKVGIDYRLQ